MNNKDLKLEQQPNSEQKVDGLPSDIACTKPNVVGILVEPHDRFKNAALFLCGYLKYSEDKVDDVASQIRRYAALNEPYELCICQKCNTLVELQFYEGDEDECNYPHYTCPKPDCRANYHDKQGKQHWKELDDFYEELEGKCREQLEDSFDCDF